MPAPNCTRPCHPVRNGDRAQGKEKSNSLNSLNSQTFTGQGETYLWASHEPWLQKLRRPSHRRQSPELSPNAMFEPPDIANAACQELLSDRGARTNGGKNPRMQMRG